MRLFRLLPLLALLALLIAPFGRMAAAEAAPHHGAPAMAEHCEQAAPGDEAPDDAQKAIDCMTACAAVAAPSAPPLEVPRRASEQPVAARAFGLVGLQPERDPPPPRLS